MKTIVIIAGIILAGATTIAVVMNDRNETIEPVSQTGGIPPIPVSNGGSPMLNPAHGLPGHRCDLAVGAPLTTSTGASPSINQQPQISTPPAGVKVNPAHGLPGHRCDLAVGAPLTTTNVSSTPTTMPPTNVNSNQQPQSSAPPAGLKVNPAHGMPGHRCDLQVGAPL